MRLSAAVNADGDCISLATFAYPKSSIGSVYLTIVKPFHAVAASRMARRCAGS